MAAPLTDHLHAVCRAVLDALSGVVPGDVLACELVQVDRRLSAYRALLEETGDAATWGRVPMLVPYRPPIRD